MSTGEWDELMSDSLAARNEGDDTDANVILTLPKTLKNQIDRLLSYCSSTVQETNKVPSPMTLSQCEYSRVDENYKMHHKRRGVALIFNQENFDVDNLKSRLGAQKDGRDLKKTLEGFQFEVRAYKDSTEQQIHENLYNVSKEDHSNADCLMVVVMTHGEEKGYLYARDRSYKEENVWKMFTADKAPLLAGKPKIFIFQACRGIRTQESDLAFDSVGEHPQYAEIYSVPTLADFLIVHSTMEGYVSWRNPTEGTMYIQDFCKVMNENSSKRDFVQLLTLVSGRVALSRQDAHHMQMPEITSTLTKFIYF